MSDSVTTNQWPAGGVLPVRYRNIFLLILGLCAALALLETGLRALGSPWLLTQRGGPGQVTLYLLGLGAIFWFCFRVVRINPFAYALAYLSDWRRALAGFLLTWAIGTAGIVALHAVMLATGSAHISTATISGFGPQEVLKTITALLVVLVLVLTEEAIFRAFLLRYLRWSPAPGVTIAAVLVSAVIFSLSHTIILGNRLASDDLFELLIGLFMLGVLFGTVYVTTGSLFCAMGIHAALLGFKVFLRKTEMIVYSGSQLTGGHDLRTGPLVWLIMGAFVLLFVLWRNWLWPRFWIEPACSPDGDNMGFRLSQAHPDGRKVLQP